MSRRVRRWDGGGLDCFWTWAGLLLGSTSR
ncbi:hypothetical protein FHS37_003489 [Streptomyces griseostramineus]|uniref:Uncharacterized protein n=1 Tax=Streptomyces griseomycini TaxID=66895 RepID=A0A7W7M063_9ACTN|nr:hypothetical protein [Streptomyces griseomycini]